jgi:hypothetical protein
MDMEIYSIYRCFASSTLENLGAERWRRQEKGFFAWAVGWERDDLR